MDENVLKNLVRIGTVSAVDNSKNMAVSYSRQRHGLRMAVRVATASGGRFDNRIRFTLAHYLGRLYD